MKMLSDFHLLRPYWLLLLIPLAGLIWRLRRQGVSRSAWAKICDSDLLPYILSVSQGPRQHWPFYLITVAAVLGTLALAGPAWEKKPQPLFRAQSALVLVLDLSLSMRAGDVAPSRLERAKLKIVDILRRRHEGQTALVVYALEAFTVSPLTDDNNTIGLMVPSLSDTLMPSQGSRPELGLAKAVELLQQAGITHGDVLLISDGVSPAALTDSINHIQQLGHKLSVLAVGTAEGAPIPLPDGGFVKDRTGSIVIPKMNRDDMQQVAKAGGGYFSEFQVDDSDINTILGGMARFQTQWQDPMSKQNVSKQNRQLKTDTYVEEGPWLVLLLLPLAALYFRRGWLICLALFSLPLPEASQAADAGNWFSRPDQVAQTKFQSGDHAAAAAQFTDKRWQAAAYYRNGDYEKAAAALQGLDNSEAAYNRGNALANLGQLDQALAAYEQAIEKDPANQDAVFNRDLVKQELQKQAQQNQNQNQKTQKSPQQSEQSSPQSSPRQGTGSQPDKQDQQGQPDPSAAQSQSGDSQQPSDQKADAASGQAAGDTPKADDSPATQTPPSQDSSPATKQTQDKQHAADKTAQQQNPPSGQVDEDTPTPDLNKPDPSAPLSAAAENLDPQQQRELQLMEQWLRRVPDDPGGLLRRKFQYQSQLQGGRVDGVKPW